MNSGKLYICPTPIGNLEDISLRVIRTLGEVDMIAAEDTRRSIKLLNHYEIKKPLISYHEHNKKSKGDILVEELKSGKNIALITDAGMPGISDPGEDIIRMGIDNDIKIVVLPGATASIVALVASGLSTDRFVFEGFLSAKRTDRIVELKGLQFEPRTIILYEAPHRLLSLLKDMKEVLGERRVSISRELTKMYEETFRGPISEGIKKFEIQKPRGEFVIVVEGSDTKEDEFKDISIKEHLKTYIDDGYTKRDAVRMVAEDRSIPKNLVYKESLEME